MPREFVLDLDAEEAAIRSVERSAKIADIDEDTEGAEMLRAHAEKLRRLLDARLANDFEAAAEAEAEVREDRIYWRSIREALAQGLTAEDTEEDDNG